MNTKIQDLPVEDRPRERLIRFGVESLSNEELLAVILRDGTKNISVKVLSCKLLQMVNGVQNLKKLKYEQLIQMKGIGSAKACLILAVVELARRIEKTSMDIQNLYINITEQVYLYYKTVLGYKEQEHFYCLYLNNHNKVLKDKLLFLGTMNHSLVHPREIFKEAYLIGASAIICVHNHPSGNILPSIDDKMITKKLKEVGELLGIKILDHVIVGEDTYYSFLENGNI